MTKLEDRITVGPRAVISLGFPGFTVRLCQETTVSLTHERSCILISDWEKGETGSTTISFSVTP